MYNGDRDIFVPQVYHVYYLFQHSPEWFFYTQKEERKWEQKNLLE